VMIMLFLSYVSVSVEAMGSCYDDSLFPEAMGQCNDELVF